MNFQISGGRDVMNQWVDVSVAGGAGQQIAHVTTTLDGNPLGDEDLNPPEVSYHRMWHQVGTGGPNETHRVDVTATDQTGKQETGSNTWQD
jgi:hypothetical protein